MLFIIVFFMNMLVFVLNEFYFDVKIYVEESVKEFEMVYFIEECFVDMF